MEINGSQEKTEQTDVPNVHDTEGKDAEKVNTIPDMKEGIAADIPEMQKTAAESLEAQKQELEKERQELRNAYLLFDTTQFLREFGLPEILAKHVMGADFEETKKIILEIKTAFDSAVQQQVEKRLTGKTPQGGAGTFFNGSSLTDQVRKSLQ